MKRIIELPRSQSRRREFLAATLAGKTPVPFKRRRYTVSDEPFPGHVPHSSMDIAVAMMRKAGKHV